MDYEYLFRRRHPFYRQNCERWKRSLAAYTGGETYIRSALIQHVSEVDLEFAERLRRAYYFNYPRKIARLITQYVLASDPVRDRCDSALAEDFSRSGLRANEVMRQLSTMLNVYGSAWLLVEMPELSGPVDAERRKRDNLRPYAMAVSPLAVTDWAFGDDGRLDWVLVEENTFDNRSPFTEPRSRTLRRLWTRDEWHLFARDESGAVIRQAGGEHRLGEVPLLRIEEADGYGMNAGHWFEDVVRVSDAILNNESEAQMNIVKQMFGLLVISEGFARGARPVRDAGSSGENEKFSHVLARSAAIWESSEESGISRYIAPNGAETAIIRSENSNLKAELFDVIGLTILRETREMQSAASKAWDHQLIRQFLVNRVDILEQAETAAWQLMHRYDPAVPVPEISYNRDFSVLDLKESIEGLLHLREIGSGSEYRKEIARAALSMLGRYKKIPPERFQTILAEIEASDPAAEGGSNA